MTQNVLWSGLNILSAIYKIQEKYNFALYLETLSDCELCRQTTQVCKVYFPLCISVFNLQQGILSNI